MYTLIITGIVLFISVYPASANERISSYSGQEQREIKALSAEEREGYLSGQGMGLAKAGELNHYPGPRHVLDLAEEMQLTDEQVFKTKEVYDRMHEEAVVLGTLILEKEKRLDNLFARNEINEKNLKDMVLDISTLNGKLRLVHLRAHLQMVDILSPRQIDSYDSLRGYKEGSPDNNQHHAHGHH
jgi:hypothetical protein